MFAFISTSRRARSSLDVDLDFLLSAPASGFSAGASATAFLDVLSWNQVLLYPQGYRRRNSLLFQPAPSRGMEIRHRPARPETNRRHNRFQPVSLETLVDSPVIAGRFFRAVDSPR